MSQDEGNFSVPVSLNWKLQLAGSATIFTGEFFSAASRAGLAKWVRPLKIGKKVSAAIRQPPRMIHLRPILSDKMPNTTKNGVARTRAPAIIRLAVSMSTLSVCVRKNRA